MRRARATAAADPTFHERPDFSVIIQSFKDHSGASSRQPQLFAERLRAGRSPPPLQLIVNDDARDGAAAWQPYLSGPNDWYIGSPNTHEIRAYNSLARFARGELLVFLQGDQCLPATAEWLLEAQRIFRACGPRLAALGGKIGALYTPIFDSTPPSVVRSRIFGSAPHPAIPYRLRLNGSAAGAESHVPFMHVAGLVMGPILVRREVFVRIGGFDESYSRVGEPGIGFDMELGLRLWTLGSRVGLYYAGVGNGVGGHKSRRDPRRRRNDRLNTRRIMELWSAHNQSIRAAVASANSELVASSALATVSAEPPRRREVRVRDPALGCRAAT